MVTEKEIFALLKNFGIKQDDKITIHSSLRSVGEIAGGADGLIDAVCKYLSEGLLLIPTHTWADIGTTCCFDVRNSVPCLGILSKVAAQRPDAIRSLHPTHSVAAFGKNAKEYIKGEGYCSSPTTLGCCLSRLYEEHGKILLIGVGHESNTFLHSIDERLQIPNRIHPETFSIRIIDYDGNCMETPPFHTFYTKGVPEGVSEHYGNYKKPLEYTGAVTYGTLGNALVYCCDAVKTVDTIKMLWEKADYDLCAQEKEIPEAYYKNP